MIPREKSSPITAGRIEVRCLEELPNRQKEQSWKGAVGPRGSLVFVQVYDPLPLPSSSSSHTLSTCRVTLPDLFMDVGGGLGGHGFLRAPEVPPTLAWPISPCSGTCAPAIPPSRRVCRGAGGHPLGGARSVRSCAWGCVHTPGCPRGVLHQPLPGSCRGPSAPSPPCPWGWPVGVISLGLQIGPLSEGGAPGVCPSWVRAPPPLLPGSEAWGSLRPGYLSCLRMATRGLRDQVFLFSAGAARIPSSP